MYLWISLKLRNKGKKQLCTNASQFKVENMWLRIRFKTEFDPIHFKLSSKFLEKLSSCFWDLLLDLDFLAAVITQKAAVYNTT